MDQKKEESAHTNCFYLVAMWSGQHTHFKLTSVMKDQRTPHIHTRNTVNKLNKLFHKNSLGGEEGGVTGKVNALSRRSVEAVRDVRRQVSL